MAQSLHLINAGDIKSKLSLAGGTAQKLAAQKTPVKDRVSELYFAAFSRPPTQTELQISVEFLTGQQSEKVDSEALPEISQQQFEDLIWALINTKEFLFNH